ncbi:MAG: glycosyltransferase family 2 protein, partial [Bacteroidia bacterium]
YEIILVNDRSPDNSWQIIQQICVTNKKVKGINLSRNYGQHNAVAAGLHNCKGDYAIVMDCDLQDDPMYIVKLIEKAKEGYDIVYTVKEERKHGIFKNITAYFFHKIFTYLVGGSNVKTDKKVGSFSLITKKVVESYKLLNDEYRPYLVMLNLLGYNSTYIDIEHRERFAGKSSYTFSKLVSHALNGIVSQTDRLLKLSIYIGSVYMLFSFIYGIYVFIKAIFFGLQAGWPTIILLITFSTGIILMFLGIIGLYISRIFLQVKNRPLYVIDHKINLE